MSSPAIFFTDLLKGLAGQLINQKQAYAECAGEDFGPRIDQNAKLFFLITVREADLPGDLAAVGALVDNKPEEISRKGYTFFIFIDSTKKHEKITDDLKTIFEKMVLSHETCHFVFYYELFCAIGADSTDTAYTQFQSKISGKLKKAMTKETDNTTQTVSDEHMYGEFLRNFWEYDNTHFDGKKLTGHDYNESNAYFFNYLTQK
jgi:hypothetical protein